MNRIRLLKLVPLLLLAGVASTPLARLAASRHARFLPDPDARELRRPLVRWVFREADLMTCRTPVFALRHLQSRFGDSVQIVAVGVGVDEAWGRSFLRAQRLHIEFESLSDAAYRERFRAAPATGMYVLLGGRVVEAFPARESSDYVELDRLATSVRELLRGPAHPAASNIPLHSSTTRRQS